MLFLSGLKVKMGIFSRIFKRNNGGQGVITDEMRQNSLEVRRMESRIKALEKQLELKAHIQELSSAVSQFGNGGSSKAEEIFMSAIAAKLLPSMFNVEPQNINSVPQRPVNNTFVEQGVQLVKKHVPEKYLAAIKNMSDDEIILIKNAL